MKYCVKDLSLARHEPGKVRLIIRVDATHQLDVRSVFVRQVAIPGVTKIAVAPGPLFLARRNVMIAHVQQPGAATVIVTAHEVVIAVTRHVRRRYRDVAVAADIGARRVIDFVVLADRDGERS